MAQIKQIFGWCGLEKYKPKNNKFGEIMLNDSSRSHKMRPALISVGEPGETMQDFKKRLFNQEDM